MKSIAAEHRPEPDVFELDLQPGDRLLICSDGLTDMVPDELIANLLRLQDPDWASGALVDTALKAGGRDNITCVVADVEDGERVCGDGTLLGAVRDPVLVVDPTAVRSAPSA